LGVAFWLVLTQDFSQDFSPWQILDLFTAQTFTPLLFAAKLWGFNFQGDLEGHFPTQPRAGGLTSWGWPPQPAHQSPMSTLCRKVGVWGALPPALAKQKPMCLPFFL
jgi:hypothetical protein